MCEPTKKFKIRFVIPGDVKERDEPNGHLAEVFSDFKFIDNNFADMPCSNVPNEPGIYEGMIEFYYVDEEDWYFELHDIKDITHPRWPRDDIKTIAGQIVMDRYDNTYHFSEYDMRWNRIIYKRCPLCNQMAAVDFPKEFVEFMKAMHKKFEVKVFMEGRSEKPWEDCEFDFLTDRLDDEWEEWQDGYPRQELLDIANFCMFLYTKMGPRNCKTCGSPIINDDNLAYYETEKNWLHNDPPPEVAEREHKRWKESCEEKGLTIAKCPECGAEMTDPPGLTTPEHNKQSCNDAPLKECNCLDKDEPSVLTDLSVGRYVCPTCDGYRGAPTGRLKAMSEAYQMISKDTKRRTSPPDIIESIKDRGMEPNMRKNIILDLDGPIANFYDCPEKCDYVNYPDTDNLQREKCPLREGTIEAITTLKKKGYRIVILTGRDSREREVTEKWLKDQGVHYDELIMDKPRGFAYADDLGYRFDTWPNFIKFIEKLEQKEKE